jgi:phosphatidylinositol alpha-1,6-mannosyltransferase
MSFPLNILLVSAGFKPGPGGVAEYAHQVALRMHRRGDRVTVLAGRAPGDEAFDETCDYEVLRADCALSPRSPDLEVVACLPEWLRVIGYVARARRADCIFCDRPFPMGLYCALAACRLCVPYVVAAHGHETPAGLGLRPIQKDYALRRADRLLCASRCARDRMAEQGVPLDRMAVIPGGVDPEAFRPTDGGRRVRDRLGLNGHRTVLTPGRLAGRRGADRVLRAMEAVLKGAPDAVCVVAGGGPCEAELRRLAQGLPGLRGHVLFAGPASDLERADFYNACDVFAMPCQGPAEGDAEGSGRAFLEAGACGKPVVAGRSGGAPDAVVDGYNGLLVDPWDAEDVAYGLTMLLTDRDYAQRLGENGLRRVREELSWEKVAERVREEIRRAVENI